MSRSFVGETSKTAVSQRAVTNKRREVLTKQVKAGQQTVVTTEPRRRDGGNRDVSKAKSYPGLESRVHFRLTSCHPLLRISSPALFQRYLIVPSCGTLSTKPCLSKRFSTVLMTAEAFA